MMRPSLKFGLLMILAAGFVACDSMELTISVNQLDDRSLEVVNTNDRVLKDVHLVIEAFESEGTIRSCGEEKISRWEPGQTVRVPACAEKVRFTLTANGETARFSFARGQVYRRIGRKEVPISR